MQIAAGVLTRAMKTLVTLIPKKTTIPVLGDIKLAPAPDGVALVATDLTTEVRVVVPADAPFPTVLPARELLEFVASVDLDATVQFEFRDKYVRVAAVGASFELPCGPVADFPKPIAHSGELVSITDGDGFLDALEWALRAVGQDPTRPQLTGVLLERDRVVAVDGHRLHVATCGMQRCPRALVPAHAAMLATRALRAAHVSAFGIGVDNKSRTVQLRIGTWTITTRQPDAEFPKYEQVIPAAARAAFRVDIETAALDKALRRVAKSGTSRGERPIKLRANGAIAIESMAADTKLATSVALIDSTHEGDDHVQGFNGRYLAEAIADGEDTTTLRFYGVDEPVVIELAGRTAVVMPMRL